MNPKKLALSLATLGLAGTCTLAQANAQTPIRLSDLQMDNIVAGAIFTDFVTTTSTMWVRGYDLDAVVEAGTPNSNEVLVTTVTERSLDCVGASINSCYAPDQPTGMNPNTVITVIGANSTSTFLSGPGRSFTNRF